MFLEDYKFIIGFAFIYSDEHNAYLFCGCLNGRSEEQFISDVRDDELELLDYV